MYFAKNIYIVFMVLLNLYSFFCLIFGIKATKDAKVRCGIGLIITNLVFNIGLGVLL